MPEIKDVVRKKLKSWTNHETKLRCEAEGVPAPDIIWTRNDIMISPLKSQPGVREIMITPKDANDFGDYVCTAKNLLGSTQQIITIEEIGKVYPYNQRKKRSEYNGIECRGILNQ